MTHGLTARNSNGRVLLSTEVEPFAFLGKAGGTEKVGQNTYQLTISSPAYPLSFVAPEQGEEASVVIVEPTGGELWRLTVVASSASFEVYCFIPSRHIEAKATHGMRLFDSDGSATYDSSKRPLVVRDAKWVAPGQHFGFRWCRRPMVSFFPKGMKETQQRYWQSDYSIEYETECKYTMEGGFVCEQYRYECITQWALEKWQVHRPTFHRRRDDLGEIPWTQMGSGEFTHLYTTSCFGEPVTAPPPLFEDSPALLGYFSVGELPPYPNGKINDDPHLVLISDASIYE